MIGIYQADEVAEQVELMLPGLSIQEHRAEVRKVARAADLGYIHDNPRLIAAAAWGRAVAASRRANREDTLRWIATAENTALGEATMNAMEHGNEYRPDLPVSIRVVHAPDTLRVQVTDLGDAAGLPERESPDLEAKLAGRQRPRGWGLFLIEKLVDEARETGGAGAHTLELVLRLGGDDDGGP